MRKFRFYKSNLLKISFGRDDVKGFTSKMPTLFIIKYIITENTRVSKKRTAHTWRQEMRYIQSGVNLERSSSPHNGSSKSKTNQSDSRLSSGETSYFELF